MTGKRRADIQGLRAVAILLVVAYHGRLGVSGGFVGVDVFFVISGFVISGTLMRELERTGSISLTGFYARRVKRLLPGLATMLTVVALAGILLAPLSAVHMSALTGIAASVFGANWYLASLPAGYFDPAATLDPLLHTWTLGVEEQFYLVYPALLLVTWRGGRRIAAVAITAATAASLFLAYTWSGTRLGFYGSPARAWEFGAGCLAAIAVPLWRRLPPLACAALAATGIAMLVAAASGGDGSLSESTGPAVFGTTLLIVAGSQPNLISSLLGRRLPAAIGDLSYSWYLWHWPLIVFAAGAFPASDVLARRVAAGASLIPAAASYVLVENRLRFAPRIRGRVLVDVASLCVCLPVAAALVQLRFPLTVPVASATGSTYLPESLLRCESSAPLGSTQRDQCVLNRRGSGDIVLIGDSNAGHFTEPVTMAAGRLGLRAVIAAYPRCPFLSLRFEDSSMDVPACLRFNRLSLAWLLRHRPNLVIVGMRSNDWISGSGHALAPLNGGAFTSREAARERLFALGLRSELRRLNAVGVPVVVVHPVPSAAFGQSSCSALLVFERTCVGSRSRSAVDTELAPTLAAERSAVAGLPESTLLDLENELCGATVCSTARDGVPLYQNATHLSLEGAESLTTTFRRVIATSARPADTDSSLAAKMRRERGHGGVTTKSAGVEGTAADWPTVQERLVEGAARAAPSAPRVGRWTDSSSSTSAPRERSR